MVNWQHSFLKPDEGDGEGDMQRSAGLSGKVRRLAFFFAGVPVRVTTASTEVEAGCSTVGAEAVVAIALSTPSNFLLARRVIPEKVDLLC